MIAASTRNRALSRGALVFLFVALALATPGFVAAPALRRVDELGLMRVVVRALSGVTLPLAGAALAVMVMATESRLRRGVDLLVGAGLDPARGARFLLLCAMVIAVGVGAPLGAATVLVLRGAARLGDSSIALRDAAGTAWAAALGAAAWTALAAAFIARSGRPSRALAVLIVDLPTRLLPGAAVWISPTTHLENLLGAPPPQSLVRVPIVPQLASALVLLVVAAVGARITLGRYEGLRSAS